MAKDPRIDAYIAAAAPFARPILEHLRDVVHAALPDVEETIKWSRPQFTLGAKNLAGMSAFKAHASFTIHIEGTQDRPADSGMGQFGRLTTLADLPPDADVIARLHAARDRLADRTPRSAPPRTPRPEIPMPADFAAALAAIPAAQTHYLGCSPSHRREYLEWVTEAKQPATRSRRIARAVELLTEGRMRYWQYRDC